MSTNQFEIELVARIVTAYVGASSIPVSELPRLIESVSAGLRSLSAPAPATEVAEKPQPAVSIRKSIQPDYLVCLEDGKKFKTLKRHLRRSYGMSPSDYRTKWGLPDDYPMVAPNYSEARSGLAKSLGLSRKAHPIEDGSS